ncbi:MAG: response regulator, partial [Myxococcales bacterium]
MSSPPASPRPAGGTSEDSVHGLSDRSSERLLVGLMVFLGASGAGVAALGYTWLALVKAGALLGALLAWTMARRTRQRAQLIEAQMCHQQAVMAEQMAKVEEQTHQIERARDEALRAVQVKDTFLATMSHELRTPLNAVIGVAGLLGGSDLSEQQREFVDIIGRSSRTLLELIGDILDMSKLEAGRLEPEESPFDLIACVDDALELVATQAHAQRLELRAEIEPGVPRTVVSDVGRLRQILTNLLSNAVKFTAQGEIVVRLDATPLEPGGWRLTFEVQDTGIGIPADRLDRLFLPFSQVDSSTTREYGGTGLGLVISRALAELLGGEMGVRSEPGRGSTFFFSITAREPSERASLTLSLLPRRVLVVDDHPDGRRAVALLAQRLGAIVVEAATADEARAAAPQGFDLTLVDSSLADAEPALLEQLHSPPGTVLKLVPRGARTSAGADAPQTLAKPVRLTALETSLRQTALDADPPASSLGRDRGPSSTTRPGQRILVVEDNAINRKVLLKMLERLGHQADAVDNGLAALEATRQQRYHVLLLDVNMPHMDGYTVAAELGRRHRRSRRPRIIGVTANALPGDREKCLSAGMDDYLPKPIEMEALERALAGPTPLREHQSINQSNILDPTLVHRLREGVDGEQHLHRLCHEFLADGAGQLQRLLDACARRDAEAAQQAAQPLLHSSRIFGAMQLTTVLLGVDLLLR